LINTFLVDETWVESQANSQEEDQEINESDQIKLENKRDHSKDSDQCKPYSLSPKDKINVKLKNQNKDMAQSLLENPNKVIFK
jgi:hypothetical protein